VCIMLFGEEVGDGLELGGGLLWVLSLDEAEFSLVASANCGFGVDSVYSNRTEQEAPTSPTDSTTDYGSSRVVRRHA
jgi:hypothetical protein